LKGVAVSLPFWLTLILFSLTYLGLALGKLPWLRTDRTGIALAGAALLLATGCLTFKQAVLEGLGEEGFGTLALLLGMMIVVSTLRSAGLFELLAGWTMDRVRGGYGLLAVTIGLGGLLSAVLVNDVVCVALTPLILDLARRLRLDPRPHLIGLALAANAGSTATPTGNPQNMIIAQLAHDVSYLRFVARLGPIALLSLVVCYLVTALVFRTALRPREATPEEKQRDAAPPQIPALRHPQKALLVKSLLVTGGAILGFVAGAPMPVVALVAAAVLLLGCIEPVRIYRQVDYGLLVMFAGLFVVVYAFNTNIVRHWGVEHWTFLQQRPVDLLSLLSAALSNLVSNVPAVLLFQPVLNAMPAGARETGWLALAMSSTLAGNLTILGSVANLIVVEQARKQGVTITLADYCKVGVPVTVLTLALGIAWLQFVAY
jgi:Na+/H+ antiporter NhaD/arsenite permease-like protein